MLVFNKKKTAVRVRLKNGRYAWFTKATVAANPRLSELIRRQMVEDRPQTAWQSLHDSADRKFLNELRSKGLKDEADWLNNFNKFYANELKNNHVTDAFVKGTNYSLDRKVEGDCEGVNLLHDYIGTDDPAVDIGMEALGWTIQQLITHARKGSRGRLIKSSRRVTGAVITKDGKERMITADDLLENFEEETILQAWDRLNADKH